MNRRRFIESLGATCRNWTWSWSFVNHKERFVIFGAWDINDEGNRALILREGWATSRRGRKQPAYAQSLEHIRLIEEEGYRLKTFPMQYELADPDDEDAPAKIKGFTPEVVDKELLRIGDAWYASDGTVVTRLPEELDPREALKEGAAVAITINQFERNSAARRECISHHGTRCIVCDFDFEQAYGNMGRGYIHVHHVVPLSEVRRQYAVNPKTDLVPICPNCHAMIHSVRPALTVDELKRQIGRK
jgi:5-methylcytosine-specific restriction protein A